MNNNSTNAIEKANEIDNQIISIFKEGKNFKVEAGAGSGKTYSLMKVLKWIQENKLDDYINKGQKIACITFTNAAVNVIQERLGNETNIVPCTIHSFVWSVIKDFQKKIINIVIENELYPREFDFKTNIIKKVNYTLGVKYYEDEILYLHHNDVIKIFSNMMDISKFRKTLACKYPVILIDEYQDANAEIITKFIHYFVEKDEKIQFGFFGDSWQTIYKNNNAIGEIKNINIIEVNKVINFRCFPKIINCLNMIRPELPQESSFESEEGDVKVIHCNDYVGVRRTDGHFSGDLPIEEMKERVKNVFKKMNIDLTKETCKVLMLTHKILSNQQDYPNILEKFGDSFKNEDDKLLLFLIETINPLINALKNESAKNLYEVLGTNRPPITTKEDKLRWKKLYLKLEKDTKEKLIDVLRTILDSKLVPIDDEITNIYNKMNENPAEMYNDKATYNEIANIQYSEYERAIAFLMPDSNYSTDHNVKGQEYDNIIFVIGKGWNLYNFEKYLPMNKAEQIENQSSYERNRNLFYVGCSRARRRLVLLITSVVNEKFESYLKKTFGNDNIISYEDYIK